MYAHMNNTYKVCAATRIYVSACMCMYVCVSMCVCVLGYSLSLNLVLIWEVACELDKVARRDSVSSQRAAASTATIKLIAERRN